jgi:predicted DNA-binding transcriptional regulator AlpA
MHGSPTAGTPARSAGCITGSAGRISTESVMTDREWLSAQELADWLGIELQAVYWLNYSRQGPRKHRIGKQLRYRLSDVELWLKTRAEG